MKLHISNWLLKILIVLGIIILMVLASTSNVHGQTHDTLNKGDHVWIMDGEDTGFGRVAEIAVDWFGKDYFGNNSWVFIRFPESGNGMRGIALSSLYKIHSCDEMVHYKMLEQNKLANDKKELERIKNRHLPVDDRMCVIHDTVYNDYYTRQGWVKDKSKALKMPYSKALHWIENYRINELGEYSNTGSKDYPVIAELIENGVGK